MTQAAHEQSCARQEDQSERDLAHEQAGANGRPLEGPFALPGLERRGQIGRACVIGRSEPREHHGHEHGDSREKQDTRVEPCGRRGIGQQRGGEYGPNPERDEQGRDPSQRGEHGAVGEQLPGQATTACAECQEYLDPKASGPMTSGAAAVSGSQTSGTSRSIPAKPWGVTPITVYTFLPSCSVLPSTARSAPNRRVQNSRLSTATCAARPTLSSSAPKKRPSSGRTPSTEKKDAVTNRPVTGSACGPSPKLKVRPPYAATAAKLRARSRRS